MIYAILFCHANISSNSLEILRVGVVKAVAAGMTQAEAARVFCGSRQVIGAWPSHYRRGGLKTLTAKSKGRLKPPSRLAGWQAARIFIGRRDEIAKRSSGGRKGQTTVIQGRVSVGGRT